MGHTKHEVLPGTLNLLILKTLASLGELHGYGIARRIEQVSGDLLELNQGTIYPALLKLEQMGWIRSRWSTSENNRRANTVPSPAPAENSWRWKKMNGAAPPQS